MNYATGVMNGMFAVVHSLSQHYVSGDKMSIEFKSPG
jgi:hypothetical protein